MPLQVVGGLGKGGFAVVVRVAHEESGAHFAMKAVAKSGVGSRREQERLRTELRVMTEVSPSPFLLRCHSAFESQADIFFVMELVEGGDLFSHLVARVKRSGEGFTEAEARALLAEIVLGLEHLHLNGFIHRDVKVVVL